MSIVELVKEIAAGVLDNSDQPAIQIGVMTGPAEVTLESQSGARACVAVKHPLEYMPKAGDKVAGIWGENHRHPQSAPAWNGAGTQDGDPQSRGDTAG